MNLCDVIFIILLVYEHLANWDGFRDNETSIRGYTFAVGDEICNDLIHPHNDPHRHLQSEEHWDNRGQIYPIPPPYTNLPGSLYVKESFKIVV